MALLAALLISISVVMISFIVISRVRNKHSINQRITAAPTSKAQTSKSTSGIHFFKKESEVLTLEEVLQAPATNIKKGLFLAGIRSKKTIAFYGLLLKISWIIPLVMIALFAIKGRLTMDSLWKIGLFGAISYTLVHRMINAKKLKRQNKMLKELPQVLDILVVTVEAGLSFTAATERMLKEVDQREPLAAEFNVMYNEYLTGQSLNQACKRMDQRCDVPELTFILNSIVQSEQLGSSLGATLRIQAIELRDKLRQKLRERALKIPIKILFPILPLFFNMFVFTLGPALYKVAAYFSTPDTSTSTSAKTNINKL